MDPFDRVKAAIMVAIGAIVVLGILQLPSGWVVVLLEWILPGLVLGAIAAYLARAITKERPPALATGTVVFGLTILFRVLFWIDTRVG